MAAAKGKRLTAAQTQGLLATLQERFGKNMARHRGAEWAKVQARLEKHPDKLWSLHEMERTGGEPDVVAMDKKTGEFTFMDCSAQSPAGRRSLCYDRAALDARKQAKPKGSAMELADAMGVAMLTEAEYRQLQELGAFDTTTSSWVQTTPEVRQRGGALFCDRRYDQVFLYHNGADSYYAARGFRAALQV